MTWALPYLYIQLIFHIRGSTEVASVTLKTLLTLLVVGIVFFLIGVAARRLALPHRTKQRLMQT
jgi:hypothetical protein